MHIDTIRFPAAWVLGTILAMASASAADKSTPPAQSPSTQPVVYKATKATAPSVRVTGGSRGSGESQISLDVLTPDSVGLTTMEQPSLFWYQSKPATALFEMTLLREDRDDPVMKITVDRAATAGIQRVNLADHNVKLTAGVEYQWVVALITDPENRSSDLVASGIVQRIEPPDELKNKLSTAPPADKAGIYAEAGIWYDALTSLCNEIDSQPDNKILRESRSKLLHQVGLKFASTADATPSK